MNTAVKAFFAIVFVIAVFIISFGIWGSVGHGCDPTDDDTIIEKDYVYKGETITLKFRQGDLDGFPGGIIRKIGVGMSINSFITPDDPVIIQLLERLSPYLEGKTDLEKANILLYFVQANIIYETDEDAFGQSEYSQYPAETLFSEHGDCEDMAYLLYTMYEKAGLDAVIIRTDSHVSVGVNVDMADGNYVTTFLSDTRYYIAEATGYRDVGEAEVMGDMARAFKPAPFFGIFLILAGSIILWVMRSIILRAVSKIFGGRKDRKGVTAVADCM